MPEQQTDRLKRVTGTVDGVDVEVSLKGDPADVEELAWQFSVMFKKHAREEGSEKK